MLDPDWTPVRQLLQDAVQQGTIPGASLSVRVVSATAILADLGLDFCVGQAQQRPVQRGLRQDTAFDLASLTKVLVTTPVVLKLWELGELDLDAPLRELLVGGPAAGLPQGITARHCLLHRSGLAAWRPLFETIIREGRSWGSAHTRDRVLELASAVAVSTSPGRQTVYSDLGFLMLGAAAEAAGGDRLDRLWERLVRHPMDLDLRWGWPGAAATEDCPVRKRVLAGEVHDLNAAVMGGIAPHAGIFGDAGAVASAGAAFVAAWQGKQGAVLRPDTIAKAWQPQVEGPQVGGPQVGGPQVEGPQVEGPQVEGSVRRLGWDGVSPGQSSAGSLWPLDGVGHLGFTGCSLWLAPRQGICVALLTNRVHPEVEGGAVPGARVGPKTAAFRRLRPAVHDAVYEAVRTALSRRKSR